jgi:hypothetical protein
MNIFKYFICSSHKINNDPLPLINTYSDNLLEIEIRKFHDTNVFTINRNFKKQIIKNFKFNVDYIQNNNTIYLTYNGINRLLFGFISAEDAFKFSDWYKRNLLKTDTMSIIEIFNKFKFPCVYLLYIGNYFNYYNVYKFGRTDDFGRRYKELNIKYNVIFKITILQYIPPGLLPSAELEIKQFLFDHIIKINNYTELVSIDNPKSVILFYKNIGNKYQI